MEQKSFHKLVLISFSTFFLFPQLRRVGRSASVPCLSAKALSTKAGSDVFTPTDQFLLRHMGSQGNSIHDYIKIAPEEHALCRDRMNHGILPVNMIVCDMKGQLITCSHNLRNI